MPIPRPNQLRYAQCELPNGMEQLIDAFVDEFYNEVRDIDLDLEDYNINTVPGIVAALKQQIELRKQLLEGAPVAELASLEALHDNLYLTNPERSENDPKVVSLEERKLGATGMVVLDGVVYENTSRPPGGILRGDPDRQIGDLEPFRRLWKAVDGNYEAFLALGDAIASSPEGSFTLVQYEPGKGKMPYTNKTFTQLKALQAQSSLSAFKQDLIWTARVGNNVSNNKKLTDIGYSNIRVSKIFSGRHPREDATVVQSTLEQSVGSIQNFAALVLLPVDDEKRKPKWINELTELTNAINFFIRFRQEINLSSSVFDQDLWGRLKASIKSKSMKELFENRPEVTSMTVPTSDITLANLLNRAAEIPLNSSIFNTYMMRVPLEGRNEEYAYRLFLVGQRLLFELAKDGTNDALVLQLQQLLQQLTGAAVAVPTKAPPPVDPIKTVGTPNGPVDTGTAINQSPNTGLSNDAANAANAGNKSLPQEAPPVQEGLEEAGNAMSYLVRRFKAAENFTSCEKSTKQSKSEGAQASAVTKANQIGKSIGVKSAQGSGSPDPKDLYGVDGKELLTNPKNLQSSAPEGSTVSRTGSSTADSAALLIQETHSTINIGGKATPVVLSTAGIEIGSTVSGPGIQEDTKVLSKESSTQLTMSKPATATASGDFSFVLKGENLDGVSTPEQAVIETSEGDNSNEISTQFEYTCEPRFENEFTKFLVEKGHLLSAKIKAACEALKRAIFLVQNIVDNLITKAQAILNQVLGLLERLLTLDLNIGGSLGIDSSLIKCSWSLDFGIKIDLFGLLLKFLNEFFRTFGAPLRAGLAKLKDIITKVICVPIRLLEHFLGGVNALLNLIGCSLKDIELPDELLELIKALMFSFDLRGLVLRKGYDAFNGMTANFGKGKDSFRGLTQFAALCQSVTMRDALNAIDGTFLATAVSAPTAAADKLGNAAGVLKKKSVGAAIGATL